MSTVSGWCSAPAGAQPQHRQCRSLTCSCECGHPWREPLRRVCDPLPAGETPDPPRRLCEEPE